MPDTLPRYMRAAKWDLEDAKKRIKATILWRRDYKPDLIPPDEVRPPIILDTVSHVLTLRIRLGLRARRARCMLRCGHATFSHLFLASSVINGFDKDGRPIIYMRPGLENTQRSPRQLRHLVWCL